MVRSAFIADMIGSRSLKGGRQEAQEYIKATTMVLNRLFAPSLEKEVIFSAGDEVQGLFKDASSALLFSRYFKRLLHPIYVRCGIGVGEWDVIIEDGPSSEQDGPAYHNARSAISNLNDEKSSCIRVSSDSFDDYLINTYLETSETIEGSQSETQRQVQLMMDLVLPVIDSGAMVQDGLYEISGLLEMKGRLAAFQGISSVFDLRGRKKDETFVYDVVDISREEVYRRAKAGKLALSRGISGRISQLRGTTRQNIDKIIKAGNIETVRNLDLASLLFAKEHLKR